MVERAAKAPSMPQPGDRLSAHSSANPRRHRWQMPHASECGSLTTRAPSQAESTPSPSPDTEPTNSWPRVTGGQYGNSSVDDVEVRATNPGIANGNGDPAGAGTGSGRSLEREIADAPGRLDQGEHQGHRS